jgi:hypothetical protein
MPRRSSRPRLAPWRLVRSRAGTGSAFPERIQFETIPRLQRAGALVFPAINLFRYPNDPERVQARRDVQALTALGVEGFQIDSAYQDFFDRPRP